MAGVRAGIQMHTSSYEQFACADEGTVTITNTFHSVAIYCLWDAGAGFQAIGTSGYNGTNIIAANYGTWVAGNTDGAICIQGGTSAHTMVFKNRKGTAGNFSVTGYGNRMDYTA